MQTALKWSHTVRNEPTLAYFGTGDHGHWAVQANDTAFAALAVLATAPELDEKRIGISREAVRERALQMLRYILATHRSGRIQCISGESWGHSWISGLGLERMAHGINALRPWLDCDDIAALRGVLISESDFLIEGYPTVAAIDGSSGKNKPESNIWNGSILYRTAALYPDAPNAGNYRHKALELMLNGISIPSDADSDTVYSGRALREWHIGPNFTENYGLHHHSYLNVGYMVICLSNIAIFHYSCEEAGITPPPEIYHHAAELWRLVKSLTFSDGRLWRIGGDTRVRYGYCQDYAVPMWMLARDLLGDPDAEHFLSGWIKLVATEQSGNPDGAFMGGRLTSLAAVSPLYFCRLEGDRAASLSMAAYWMRRAAGTGRNTSSAVIPAMDSWHDEFHGAAMVRGKRLASWVWKSAQRPCGTVAPADRSDLVEWQWNLAGRISGTGCGVSAKIDSWRIDRFAGGFVNCGSYRWFALDNPAEGSKPEETARTQIVFAALPDDATVVVLQQVRTLKPVYLNEVAGLFLNVPNDIYNGSLRTYQIAGSECRIAGAGGKQPPEMETIHCGERLGIEGRMEIRAIYGGELKLQRPGKRLVNLAKNAPLHYSGEGANLYCDLVCLPYDNQQKFYEEDSLLYDIGAAVVIDGESQAALLSAPDAAEKVIEVTGADGQKYLLAANFGPLQVKLALPGEALKAEVLSGPKPEPTASGLAVELASGEAALLRLPLKGIIDRTIDDRAS